MLKITQQVYDDMISHAKEELPIEACGYLGKKDGVISKICQMKNIDQSAEHFSFDPKEQFEAIKDFRNGGFSMAVVYHSHPSTPSRPSAEDIKLAYDPNVSYIIVSLKDSVPVVNSFLIKNGKVTQEEIEII